mmetsp:Transcript_3741/g.7707  ORF Transcript_3741/g.7707 Transcript_3741/m.7707 type:complete len:98 (-) Transcript_3741:852-1145(-)
MASSIDRSIDESRPSSPSPYHLPLVSPLFSSVGISVLPLTETKAREKHKVGVRMRREKGEIKRADTHQVGVQTETLSRKYGRKGRTRLRPPPPFVFH